MFNLSEMTSTRSSLRLASGEFGHGYVQGRDKAAAQAAALVNALIQTREAEVADPAQEADVAFCGPAGAMERSGRIEQFAGATPPERFAIGTPDNPDRSATLIVEMPELSHAGARLSGPGIKESAALNLPERKGQAFPCWLGFILASGDRVAAVPRSTWVG